MTEAISKKPNTFFNFNLGSTKGKIKSKSKEYIDKSKPYAKFSLNFANYLLFAKLASIYKDSIHPLLNIYFPEKKEIREPIINHGIDLLAGGVAKKFSPYVDECVEKVAECAKNRVDPYVDKKFSILAVITKPLRWLNCC